MKTNEAEQVDLAGALFVVLALLCALVCTGLINCTPPPPKACTPITARVCACDAGEGRQVCDALGQWKACDCTLQD